MGEGGVVVGAGELVGILGELADKRAEGEELCTGQGRREGGRGVGGWVMRGERRERTRGGEETGGATVAERRVEGDGGRREGGEGGREGGKGRARLASEPPSVGCACAYER